MNKKRLFGCVKKAGNMFVNFTPVMLTTALLISFVFSVLPKNFFTENLSGNVEVSTFLASIFGSISAGNPVTSFVIGGELLKNGIGLVAVTVFIVSWVTVGVVQMPAEAIMLGRKFAITRNILSFVFSFIVAFVSVYLFGFLQ